MILTTCLSVASNMSTQPVSSTVILSVPRASGLYLALNRNPIPYQKPSNILINENCDLKVSSAFFRGVSEDVIAILIPRLPSNSTLTCHSFRFAISASRVFKIRR